MYKNTGLIDKNLKKYVDDLYEVLYMCKLYKKKIYITLTTNKSNHLTETNNCYIQLIMYINKNNIKRLYNFVKLHLSSEIFNNLLNVFEINKFINNKNYGLLLYISDTKNILTNTHGGFIIIYNTNFNITISENNKELFSSSYYI